MVINKRGATGEGIVTIYRVMLVAIIAFIVLGFSAVFYSYNIDVRSVEANIMVKNLVNCLTPSGSFDLTKIPSDKASHILDYCGIKNDPRIYVQIEVNDGAGHSMNILSQGDTNIEQLNSFLESVTKSGANVNYQPGFASIYYPADITLGEKYAAALDKPQINYNQLKIGVLVTAEN